ncbi:hypothetical protein ACR3K2_19170 [Cryptosporidium serpentis]
MLYTVSKLLRVCRRLFWLLLSAILLIRLSCLATETDSASEGSIVGLIIQSDEDSNIATFIDMVSLKPVILSKHTQDLNLNEISNITKSTSTGNIQLSNMDPTLAGISINQTQENIFENTNTKAEVNMTHVGSPIILKPTDVKISSELYNSKNHPTWEDITQMDNSQYKKTSECKQEIKLQDNAIFISCIKPIEMQSSKKIKFEDKCIYLYSQSGGTAVKHKLNIEEELRQRSKTHKYPNKILSKPNPNIKENLHHQSYLRSIPYNRRNRHIGSLEKKGDFIKCNSDQKFFIDQNPIVMNTILHVRPASES